MRSETALAAPSPCPSHEALVEALRGPGMVLACCYCQKLRAADHSWHPVAVEPGLPVLARVSHGICPECWQSVVVEEYGCDLPYLSAPAA